ncbi:single-stranded DNA-binding protein [Castellaniella sp.]|uniref:single-stranded DNA-binding protein n=1 Tax=Castellaniella sp. TaxID=1955812 RepID=UPI002AFF9BC8|nr:single-stranded DNA-binding protein [Castellaniella sp.]
MFTYNKAEVLGNLGADPLIRTFQNGGRVCKFPVATSNSWKDTEGKWKEETYWHSIVIFDEHFIKRAEKHLKKGSKVLVEGAMETRKFEKDGQDHYMTEIVLRQYGKGSLILVDGTQSED